MRVSVKLADIFITKEREEIDGIDGLADSIGKLGYFIHLPIVYKDEKGRILVAAGRRRLRAAEKLGWEFVDVDMRELTPVEVDIIRIEENLKRQELTEFQRAKNVREIFEIYRRTFGAKKQTGKPGRPNEGKTEAMKKAAEKIGVSESTIKKQLKIANISKNAVDLIVGTKLEDNQDILYRIAQQPKESHLKLVHGLQNGLTFEETLRRLEKSELKGHDWPDDFNDTFTNHRKELLFLINKIKGELNKNYSILAKYKEKPRRNQIYRTAQRMKTLYEEIIAELTLALPFGPCPYCSFKGCENCLQDGYAIKDLLIAAQKEGIEIKVYFK